MNLVLSYYLCIIYRLSTKITKKTFTNWKKLSKTFKIKVCKLVAIENFHNTVFLIDNRLDDDDVFLEYDPMID